MKKLLPFALLATALVFGAAVAQAAKVTICHIPPGNPDNWHTISISTNALQTHIDRHGDLVGSCQANCEALCDDGDKCTQDVIPDLNECICATDPTPVDCDDQNTCTADGCDPATGCLNDPSGPDGDVCEDPDTGDPGVCDTGVCEPPVDPPDDCSLCVLINDPCSDIGAVFQSCDSCGSFVECVSNGGFGGGTLLPMSCPSGLVWDDLLKACAATSSTCTYDDGVCSGGPGNT